MTTRQELQLACPPGGGPYACPCCRLLTLESRCEWEICAECGWEDDGQDDHDADRVLGGPNGRLSLTEARAQYSQYAASLTAPDPTSVSAGGPGAWQTAARRRMRDSGHLPEEL
ncbi:CPCC family cysteine-rich protein [Streptacidiphilus sp. N1-3]|uniref:CPCC family cysteine-rich protein n=1 Tax=Streptacidiphilus alkalitolerans TaxID=3342712 RepID=A0ABV6XBT4_9ACTN